MLEIRKRRTPMRATLPLLMGEYTPSLGVWTVYVAERDGVDRILWVESEMGRRSMVSDGEAKQGAWY